MMRNIVTPAVLPPAALAELKDWLGITTSADDAGLSALLNTALDVCADYIGLLPLISTVEEMVPLPTDQRRMPGAEVWQQQCYPADWRHNPLMPGWYRLDTRPVVAVMAAYGVAADGSRSAFTADQFTSRIEADGTCAIRVSDPGNFQRAVLRFSAGLAADWSSLAVPLRHGIMRLAAHHYRNRDNAGAEPPATVVALWRPWRRLRLV